MDTTDINEQPVLEGDLQSDVIDFYGLAHDNQSIVDVVSAVAQSVFTTDDKTDIYELLNALSSFEARAALKKILQGLVDKAFAQFAGSDSDEDCTADFDAKAQEAATVELYVFATQMRHGATFSNYLPKFIASRCTGETTFQLSDLKTYIEQVGCEIVLDELLDAAKHSACSYYSQLLNGSTGEAKLASHSGFLVKRAVAEQGQEQEGLIHAAACLLKANVGYIAVLRALADQLNRINWQSRNNWSEAEMEAYVLPASERVQGEQMAYFRREFCECCDQVGDDLSLLLAVEPFIRSHLPSGDLGFIEFREILESEEVKNLMTERIRDLVEKTADEFGQTGTQELGADKRGEVGRMITEFLPRLNNPRNTIAAFLRNLFQQFPQYSLREYLESDPVIEMFVNGLRRALLSKTRIVYSKYLTNGDGPEHLQQLVMHLVQRVLTDSRERAESIQHVLRELAEVSVANEPLDAAISECGRTVGLSRDARSILTTMRDDYAEVLTSVIVADADDVLAELAVSDPKFAERVASYQRPNNAADNGQPGFSMDVGARRRYQKLVDAFSPEQSDGDDDDKPAEEGKAGVPVDVGGKKERPSHPKKEARQRAEEVVAKRTGKNRPRRPYMR